MKRSKKNERALRDLNPRPRGTYQLLIPFGLAMLRATRSSQPELRARY